MKKPNLLRWMMIVAVAVMMTACGGGGGGGGSNHAPVATAQSVTTNEDIAKAITLSGTDEDSDTLSYTVVTNPAHGTLSGTAPILTYTPNANWSGSDSFTFKVNDGTVDSNISTIDITVSAVNDVPTASGFEMTLDIGKLAVTADWKAQSSASDLEGDALTATVQTQGSHGNFVITGAGVSYIKSSETNGTDTGIISISDGHDAVQIPISVECLYWKQFDSKKDFTIALKSDGTVWSWGSNAYGQIGDGTTIDRDCPTQEQTHATDWTQVAAGYNHSIAIKANGTLWAWGRNTSGQLGDDTQDDKYAPTQEDTHATNWSKAAAGESFSVALTSDGRLRAWGHNGYGQLGNDTLVSEKKPKPVDGNSAGWSDVAVGTYHVLALKATGTLWGWGSNTYGQVGDGNHGAGIKVKLPTQIAPGISDWREISCGALYSLAIKDDGALYAWGRNSIGQLGVGDYSGTHYTPTQVGSENWSSVDGGYDHSIGVRDNGTLWSWGSNVSSQRGDLDYHPTPAPFQIGADDDWNHATASETTSLATKNNRTLYGWGHNLFGQLGNKKTDTQYTPLHIQDAHTWKKVSMCSGGGSSHVLAIRNDNKTLWAWGVNGSGQLGNNLLGGSYVFDPVQENSAATNWKDVATGYSFSVGLRTDGTLWTWGSNNRGQLGLGNNDNKLVPTQVAGTWKAICANSYHTLAINNNNELYAWGGNGSGQLGVGDTSDHTSPTQVGTHNDWSQISCGTSHTAGIRHGSELWMWGSNMYGKLGIGSADAYKTSPEQVSGSWSQVSLGNNHTLAINGSDHLYAWGSNAMGQVGGPGISYSTPQLKNTDMWGIVSAGGDISMAIRADNNTVWVWGDNSNGNFAKDGREIRKSNTLLQIDALDGTVPTSEVSLSVSHFSTLLIKNDHTMWTWGSNEFKRLSRDWYTKTPTRLFERAP